jgi:hypothetical protein
MRSTHPLVRSRPRSSLLSYGFWILSVSLLLHQLLVVVPAYRGALLPAYYAGWALKDMSFDVPIYTPYSIVLNLLFFPVLLLIAFVRWVAPLLTIVWGVRLGQRWRDVAAIRKWIWIATLLVLWGVTLMTKAASTAFLIWLLD